MVEGKVQKEGEVIHVVVKRCHDLSGLLGPLSNPEARASEDQSEDRDMSGYPGARKQKLREAEANFASRPELVKSNNGPSFHLWWFAAGGTFSPF